jgi:hypothetical protein
VGSAVLGSVLIQGLGAKLAGIQWGPIPAPLRAALSDPQVIMAGGSAQEALSHVPPEAREAVRAQLAPAFAQTTAALAQTLHVVFAICLCVAALGLLACLLFTPGLRLDREPSMGRAPGPERS